ncbi:dihydrolipoamide acetyltransferase family protein [Rarobacter faecitabidus]|uniref:Dihydrolipoamide acetyltransferase component of pyruvate dehydrogenase complex n=1 Tax=Rarobacter faecitabidus TaxID=13243 RepID=A0A542ZPC4_RARFA|nr:dihydrolipoamide acetyltransferase family protein [Rarobacter faecitabidus]TQL62089.1 pyruvate dehydrogenase E2 component (dihydrolipoamide acetyltransferase) [Rarobacter faecitabidus]
MPTYQRFELPDAGEGLTEADIVEWRVAPGDAVEVNQIIVEIETAKSLVELPSPWSGVVAEIVVPVGQTAAVGDPIIVIDIDPEGEHGSPDERGSSHEPGTPVESASSAAPAEAGSSADNDSASPGRAAASDAPAADPAAPAAPAAPATGGGAVLVGYGTAGEQESRRHRPPSGQGDSSTLRVLAKPPVRRLARDLGIDLATVTPSGPGGIVTREDVLAHQVQVQARELATYEGDDQPWLADGDVSPDGRQTRVPVRSVRKRTAEAMVSSAFSAPHVTVFHTVDVTRTMKLVSMLREDREFSGVRVTPLLIAMKALLLAIDRHPEINASWDEDRQQIVYKHYVNLGIAAATPRGLIVPNIKDAHRLGLFSLARSLGELTANARASKTRPADMSDGTITITNVGVFGIDTGTPILNPGEAAILAFGAIRQQPWVHKGKIKVRHVTQLALSFDHRLVDGELGSRVLADVAKVLEEPARALVWG